MPVRIVTDSNCDLPAELVARHNIVVVPAILMVGGQALRDGVEISRAEFYRRLPTLDPWPSTAAPAAGDFEAAFRSCGQAEIIAIVLAARFSAIYNAARLGAEPLGRQVTLVDSQQVSMGLGWQVLAAAEAASAGCSRVQALAEARGVAERLAGRAAEAGVMVEATAALGVHVGPGAVGVAAVVAR